MSVLTLVFLSFAGGVLQSSIPSSVWLGHATFPFLLGLVLHEALLGRPRRLLATSLLTGLVADAMTPVPLGYSAALYLFAGQAVYRIRDLVVARQWTTQSLLGGVAHLLCTAGCFVLLLIGDRPGLSGWSGAARALGALVTGAIAVPLAFHAVARTEQFLGHRPEREAT